MRVHILLPFNTSSLSYKEQLYFRENKDTVVIKIEVKVDHCNLVSSIAPHYVMSFLLIVFFIVNLWIRVYASQNSCQAAQ